MCKLWKNMLAVHNPSIHTYTHTHTKHSAIQAINSGFFKTQADFIISIPLELDVCVCVFHVNHTRMHTTHTHTHTLMSTHTFCADKVWCWNLVAFRVHYLQLIRMLCLHAYANIWHFHPDVSAYAIEGIYSWLGRSFFFCVFHIPLSIHWFGKWSR